MLRCWPYTGQYSHQKPALAESQAGTTKSFPNSRATTPDLCASPYAGKLAPGTTYTLLATATNVVGALYPPGGPNQACCSLVVDPPPFAVRLTPECPLSLSLSLSLSWFGFWQVGAGPPSELGLLKFKDPIETLLDLNGPLLNPTEAPTEWYGQVGAGPPSELALFETSPAAPAAPTALTACATTAASVSLVWMEPHGQVRLPLRPNTALTACATTAASVSLVWMEPHGQVRLPLRPNTDPMRTHIVFCVSPSLRSRYRGTSPAVHSSASWLQGASGT